MADDFDRARFAARLGAQRLGQRLVVRASTASTNDDAWEALGTLGDGAIVLALEQTQGRGRAGRRWEQVPGRGLAMSVALHPGCDVRQAGVIPLAAGLAVVQACHALGVPAARLKWPNDVQVGDSKLAGVLCEMRRAAAGGHAVVIGIGLNVRHLATDFPDELRGRATSLALEGSDAMLEDAAAEVLRRLQPLWIELQEGDRAALLAEWSRWCTHWGRSLTVRTPAGDVSGTALRLEAGGGLVLRTEAGAEVTVVAGDVLATPEGSDAR